MKKLFALVLALAMALAIAIPTMATGWEPIVPDTKPAEDITFGLYGLETKENTAVLGGLYEELTATYPLVKGTDVHFMVVVSIPAEAKLSAANKTLLEKRKLDLEVSADYIDIAEAYVYVDDAAAQNLTGKIVEGVFTDDIGTEHYGHTLKYEFWGKGTKAGKDATVTATLGYYNEWVLTSGIYVFEAMNGEGKVPFTVCANGKSEADVTAFDVVDSKNNVLRFPIAKGYIDTSKVITITVASGTYAATYEVNRNVNSDITFKNTTSGVVYGPNDKVPDCYIAVKAIFDNYFAMLGFQYAGADAMTPAHFENYFGTINEVVGTLVYPAGYVTVTNPSVEPPQTGDATTVVGFVMIAIALVAAAVVTVKKVRA